MNLEQVQKQISRFSKAKSILACYEIELLPSILKGHENILYALTGTYNQRKGVLVCTEERLIFVHKGLEEEVIESLHYPYIEHSYVELFELSGQIELFSRGTRYKFESLVGEEAKLLNNFIGERKISSSIQNASESKIQEKGEFKERLYEGAFNNSLNEDYNNNHRNKKGFFSYFFGCFGITILLLILMGGCSAFFASLDEPTEPTDIGNTLINEQQSSKQEEKLKQEDLKKSESKNEEAKKEQERKEQEKKEQEKKEQERKAQEKKEQEKAKLPNLEVLEIDSESDAYWGYATGKIRNNTNRNYGYVQVEVNMYDSNGNLIGSTLDNVNNLAPGKIWSFKAIITDDRTSTFEVVDVTGF